MDTYIEKKQFHKIVWFKKVLYAGLTAVSIAVVFMAVINVFFHARINGYIEKRIVHEFSSKYPACAVKISRFDFSLWNNRITADSVALTSADTAFSCAIGTFSVSGIMWTRLVRKEHRNEAISEAVVDAHDIVVKFRNSDYGFSCKRVRVSMPDGEILAEGAGFKPFEEDTHFFARKKFRATRFRLSIPACRISGLAVKELLQGTGYRARSIQIDSPSIDALVHRYVPVAPDNSRLPMPNEMMKAIHKKIRLESLKIVNGYLSYSEVYAPGALPAIITLDSMQLRSDGIGTGEVPGETTAIHCRANFMQGGIVTMDMALPLSSQEFSVKYSGTLNAMQLTKLNAFLDHSEYVHIDSGILQTATYDVEVTSGRASGTVKALYKHLKISILNKKTGSSQGIVNEVGSLIMNNLKIRTENMPGSKVSLKIGKVNYKRRSQNTFIQFLWFSLRTGILDVLY